MLLVMLLYGYPLLNGAQISSIRFDRLLNSRKDIL